MSGRSFVVVAGVAVAGLLAACSLIRDLDELEPGAGDAGASDARRGACPTGMVEEHFADDAGFCIDRTEVTQEAYATFLAQDAGAPPKGCETNTSLRPDEVGADCGTFFDAVTLGTLPVVCVDHCDATTYCRWRGARLCGAKGGRNLEQTAVNHRDQDEWFVACSGDRRTFPTGDTAGGCVVAQKAPEPAASAGCATPEEVLHLSGNVAEWTATCGAGESRCLARGGSFGDSLATDIRCEHATGDGGAVRPRATRMRTIGFRCCRDL
jgi:formylglycine-generating enzyme required for sulfatase activity